MGWTDDYAASEVAKKLEPGERVLLDGKRATFMVISDGKEHYEFALEDEARCVCVDLRDLDRRVKVERWEVDPEPDWQKEGEDFVRWLRSCRQWVASKEATIPVPPTVVRKAIRIIEELTKPVTVKELLDRPPEDWPRTGTRCSVCHEPQYNTPGGLSCKNGHGGAPPLERNS